MSVGKDLPIPSTDMVVLYSELIICSGVVLGYFIFINKFGYCFSAIFQKSYNIKPLDTRGATAILRILYSYKIQKQTCSNHMEHYLV